MIIIALLYFGQAVIYAWSTNYALSVVVLCYAVANAALIAVSYKL